MGYFMLTYLKLFGFLDHTGIFQGVPVQNVTEERRMIKWIGSEPHRGESGADRNPLAGSKRPKPPAGRASWFWVLIAVISVAAGTALAACPAFLAEPSGAAQRRPAGDGTEEITISIPVPQGKEILAVAVYAAGPETAARGGKDGSRPGAGRMEASVWFTDGSSLLLRGVPEQDFWGRARAFLRPESGTAVRFGGK